MDLKLYKFQSTVHTLLKISLLIRLEGQSFFLIQRKSF